MNTHVLGLKICLQGNSNPFIKPFKLAISLGVGGRFFSGPNSTALSEQDVKSWNCSALILDYVRIWRWVPTSGPDINYSNNRTQPESTLLTSSDKSEICKHIMSAIRFLDNDQSSGNSIAITVASVTVVTMVLLVVTALNIVVYYRKAKKTNKSGMYDDSGTGQRQYYENPEENYYSPYNKNISAVDVQNNYLEIDNKYI